MSQAASKWQVECCPDRVRICIADSGLLDDNLWESARVIVELVAGLGVALDEINLVGFTFQISVELGTQSSPQVNDSVDPRKEQPLRWQVCQGRRGIHDSVSGLRSK